MARRGPLSAAKRKREADKRAKRQAKQEKRARRAEEKALAKDGTQSDITSLEDNELALEGQSPDEQPDGEQPDGEQPRGV